MPRLIHKFSNETAEMEKWAMKKPYLSPVLHCSNRGKLHRGYSIRSHCKVCARNLRANGGRKSGSSGPDTVCFGVSSVVLVVGRTVICRKHGPIRAEGIGPCIDALSFDYRNSRRHSAFLLRVGNWSLFHSSTGRYRPVTATIISRAAGHL